jgi:multimeric flavodoxin WrbA
MSNLPEYTAADKYVVSSPTYLPDYSSINKNYAELPIRKF